jgi:hypothetical protein
MRYVKQKSTGRYYSGLSGGDPSKPEHLTHMVNEVVAGQGISADDLESGYMDDGDFEMAMSAQMEANKTYAEKRKESYPPTTDYLDGIVKGDQTQIDKYISDCLAIKEKFPKE